MSWKTERRRCEQCNTFYRIEGLRFCSRCADKIRDKLAEENRDREQFRSSDRRPDQKEKISETKNGIDD